MPTFMFELVIVLLLIVLNGAFAMSEMAIVSARKSRLEHRAEGGDRRARIALNLANDPNELLSTIQVGITLIGIINGAYGGASLAAPVADVLRTVPFLAPYSTPISFGLVVSIITYLSLVVGEMVPKRLALSNPERIAVIVAVPMRTLASLARPIVRLLSASNDFVLRLLGNQSSKDAPVTEDEIKLLIEQGTHAGVFRAVEQTLVERVFRLGDRHVGEVMTPRHEVVWLDIDDEPDELRDGLDFGEPDSGEPANYRSLGGLVTSRLGRVPSVGDVVAWAGLRFEVLDMDGMCVDRLRVRALDADGAGSENDGENVP
jgi:putative hemolysin